MLDVIDKRGRKMRDQRKRPVLCDEQSRFMPFGSPPRDMFGRGNYWSPLASPPLTPLPAPTIVIPFEDPLSTTQPPQPEEPTSEEPRSVHFADAESSESCHTWRQEPESDAENPWAGHMGDDNEQRQPMQTDGSNQIAFLSTFNRQSRTTNGDDHMGHDGEDHPANSHEN